MRFRNAIKALFGNIKKYVTSMWREIGGYTSRFTSFGRDMYANDIVRACIRTLAEHSSKANVKVVRKSDNGRIDGDKNLQRLIQFRPNIYMNGKDFLYKCRTILELYNTLFIFIKRDEFGRCTGLYPIPDCSSEAVDVSGKLFIKFYLPDGSTLIASWEDLAVLRKDFNKSDIWGDDNSAIITSLETLNTTNEGMTNAIKSTANLRGLLKSTKAMLSDVDRKRQQEAFVSDYMNIANTSGVAVLDSTQTFDPVTITPYIANYKNIEELRNNIYRYFGINEDIVMSKVSGDEWEAFYESRLEPFLLALSLELTNKIFTDRERGYGNEIIFEANRLQYASTTTKMNMVQLIDRGILTINEYREVLNLSPVDGGDVRVIRKEYAEANKLNEIQGVKDADSKEPGIPGNEPVDDSNGKTA